MSKPEAARRAARKLEGRKVGRPWAGKKREAAFRAMVEHRVGERIQRDTELNVAATVEQIRRGALFDPRDLFYAESGEEFYTTNGPPMQDALGNWGKAWKKGELKRSWNKGDLKPMDELTEAQAQSITSIEVVMKNATAGDGQIDRVLKIRLAPREKYVELAARYHGMLVDRTETNVNVHVVGSKLDEARARLASLPDVLVPGQLLPPRAPDAE